MGQRKPPGPVTGQECTTLASFSLVFSDVILGHISPDHRMSSIALVGQNESSRTFSKSLSRFLRQLRTSRILGSHLLNTLRAPRTDATCSVCCMIPAPAHTPFHRPTRLKGGLVALVPHVGRGLMFPPQGLGIQWATTPPLQLRGWARVWTGKTLEDPVDQPQGWGALWRLLRALPQQKMSSNS